MVWKRVTKFANVGLVKGRTFANPAVHPHRNDMGVPPPPRAQHTHKTRLPDEKINRNLDTREEAD